MRDILLLLALFLVPVLALAVGLYPYYNEGGMELVKLAPQSALSCLLTPENATLLTWDGCQSLWIENLMILIAPIAIAFGVIILLLPRFAVMIAGGNRAALSAAVPAVSLFSILTLTFDMLMQGALLTGTYMAASAMWLGFYWPYLVFGLILGTCIIAAVVFGSGMKLFERPLHEAFAQLLKPETAPNLRRLVDDTARRVGIKPPENILIGLEPNFYVTSLPVKLSPGGESLKGDSIYLSAPMLRILSDEEVRTIIGHEMGHFVGKDTIVSERLNPSLFFLSNVVTELGNNPDMRIRVLGAPARLVADDMLTTFFKPMQRISREREFAADQVGIAQGSARGLATGLAKFSALAAIWNIEINYALQRLSNGRVSRNLSRNFVERTQYDIDRDEILRFTTESLEKATEHPFDSHPATRARITAVGIDPASVIERESFLNGLFPKTSVLTPEDNLEAIEEELTISQNWHLERLLNLNGYAIDASGTWGQVYAAQMLAKMVVADGVVKDAEIYESQKIAAEHLPDFDQAVFREYCRHPENLVDVDELIRRGNMLINPEQADLLKSALERIAHADGNMSPEEADLTGCSTEDGWASIDDANEWTHVHHAARPQSHRAGGHRRGRA